MRSGRAFTLVEILIVVVILGILAAIVVPQFASATKDASAGATLDQLTKIRHALDVYYVRNGNVWPQVVAPSDGDWGELTLNNAGDYMRQPPKNMWVNPVNALKIVPGTGPDTAYQSDYGWIYDAATGKVWAGAFDVNDKPFQVP